MRPHENLAVDATDSDEGPSGWTRNAVLLNAMLMLFLLAGAFTGFEGYMTDSWAGGDPYSYLAHGLGSLALAAGAPLVVLTTVLVKRAITRRRDRLASNPPFVMAIIYLVFAAGVGILFSVQPVTEFTDALRLQEWERSLDPVDFEDDGQRILNETAVHLDLAVTSIDVYEEPCPSALEERGAYDGTQITIALSAEPDTDRTFDEITSAAIDEWRDLGQPVAGDSVHGREGVDALYQVQVREYPEFLQLTYESVCMDPRR